MNIWYPSHCHEDGHCRVDIAWFNTVTFKRIAKAYPKAKIRTPEECGDPKHMAKCACIELPERVEIKNHIFEFNGGIPYELQAAPIFPKRGKMIIFKREPIKK